jgi:hypothetical protein
MYLLITLRPTYSETTRWVLFWAMLGGGLTLGWGYWLTLGTKMFGVPWKDFLPMNLGGFGFWLPKKQVNGPWRIDAPYFA